MYLFAWSAFLFIWISANGCTECPVISCEFSLLKRAPGLRRYRPNQSHLWGRHWAALAIPPSCLLQFWDSFGANIPKSCNRGCGYPTAMGDSQEINLSILCMEEVRLPLEWGRGAEKLNDTLLELNARVERAEAVRDWSMELMRCSIEIVWSLVMFYMEVKRGVSANKV